MWKNWILKMNVLGKTITGFKQKTVEAKPVSRFFYLLVLAILQTTLIIISLPVFIFLPVSSYKKYSGNKPGLADSYQMRRLIILATTGGIIILLVIKIVVGIIAGASTDYASTHPSADDLLDLKTSRVVSDENVAVIQGLEFKNFGNDLVFRGTAPAKSRVILFVDAGGELVYKTMSDSSGTWKITHSQNNVNILQGSHSAHALVYKDSDPGTYSYSNVFAFSFYTSRWSVFAGLFNPGIILLFLGAVLTLWVTHVKLRKD